MYPPRVLADIATRGADGEKIVRYLTSNEEGARIRSRELNRYLEVAYRHKAVDPDLQARLRSEHWNTFLQAVNELQAAYFFHRKERFRLEFRPRGQGRSIGEFELIKKGIPRIFVEVKSPNRTTPTGVWCGSDEDVVKSNVLRACEQIPTDGRPTLVVMAGDLRVPISDPFGGVMQALYGSPIKVCPINSGASHDAVQREWTHDGVFQPDSNQHLSAVATLLDNIGSPYLDSIFHNITIGTSIDSTLPLRRLSYWFAVYHNPYARMKIDPGLFGRWRQVGPLPGNDQAYGWLEPRRSPPRRRIAS
jgi:hypothetical protein